MIPEPRQLDALSSDDRKAVDTDALENLSSSLWFVLSDFANRPLAPLKERRAASAALPELIVSGEREPDEDDSICFAAADKEDDERPIKEFKARGIYNDALTEYTVKIYDKSAHVTDANGVEIDVDTKKNGDGTNAITKATMKYEGKDVGKITDGEYTYLHHGQWKKIKIEKSTFRDDGVIELKTEDKTTILIRPDGSKIEMNNAGRPILVDDANGNRIEYKWAKFASGKDKLEYVSMQGPMTKGELVEYKFTLKVDPQCGPLPESQQNMYKVYVKGVHQASQISFGAGAGAGLQYGPASGGINAGFGVPLGKTVELQVGGTGLTIKQYAEVLDGMFSNESTSYTLIPDGTNLQRVKSGWLTDKIESVSYDKQGNKRIRGR